MLDSSLPRRAQRKACEVQKKAAVRKPGECSPGRRSAGILILDFADSSL